MQIRKDGAVIFNSIDNTGATDGASLSARYAKGRLDTLEGNFNNYFNKTEVLDLLAQKVGAEFVDQLPADLETNVWYYSKKYADGTAVADDKRALYTKDTNDVVQYLGVMGEVNLEDYATIADNDERYQQKITDSTVSSVTNSTYVSGVDTSAKTNTRFTLGTLWNWITGKIATTISSALTDKDIVSGKAINTALTQKAPLEQDYDLITTSDPLQVDNCRFNFYKKQDTFTRIAERRLFNAYGPDPLGGGNVWGTCEVKQMVRSNGVMYIEQTLTQFQGDPGSDTSKYVKKFFRRGTASGVTNPFTQAATASVTWTSWKPIDYPKYSISGTDCIVSVKGGFCYVSVMGTFSPTGSGGDIYSLFTIPSCVRPGFEVHAQIQNAYGQTGGAVQTIWCGTNGVVNCWGLGYSWQNIRGSFKYPINY